MTEKDKAFLRKFCFYFACFIVFSLQVLFLVNLWFEKNFNPFLLIDLSVIVSIFPWYWLYSVWLEVFQVPSKLVPVINKCRANPWFWIVCILITFLWTGLSIAWLYLIECSSPWYIIVRDSSFVFCFFLGCVFYLEEKITSIFIEVK